jgi:L-threonylcarbamoyladenylate synthase
MDILTSVFRLDSSDMDSHLMALAADVLRAGGLVAFPTETVYGLGANALDAAAVERIFTAKGRPATDPLIVHINTPSQFQQVAADIPPLAHQLADAFWPGPLTLVLKRQAHIPANVSAGRDTVAVRMPSHPITLELLDAVGVPLAAPSANRFGHTSPTTAQHVYDDLNGRVDVIFDGGPTPIGVESTVVDLSVVPPRLLRPGGVSLEALREHLPDIVYTPPQQPLDQAAVAPGMFDKHYAPNTELHVYEGEGAAVLAAMEQAARQALADGRRVGVLVPDDEAGVFLDERVAVVTLGDSLPDYAANLFAALRQLETADLILAHGFSREGLGLAIWDRLVRAASVRVVV